MIAAAMTGVLLALSLCTFIGNANQKGGDALE